MAWQSQKGQGARVTLLHSTGTVVDQRPTQCWPVRASACPPATMCGDKRRPIEHSGYCSILPSGSPWLQRDTDWASRLLAVDVHTIPHSRPCTRHLWHSMCRGDAAIRLRGGSVVAASRFPVVSGDSGCRPFVCWAQQIGGGLRQLGKHKWHLTGTLTGRAPAGTLYADFGGGIAAARMSRRLWLTARKARGNQSRTGKGASATATRLRRQRPAGVQRDCNATTEARSRKLRSGH